MLDEDTIFYLPREEEDYAAVLCRVVYSKYGYPYVEKVTCTKYGENYGPDIVAWNIIANPGRARVVPYCNWALYVMKGSWDGTIIS
jgi:hypothetical protein